MSSSASPRSAPRKFLLAGGLALGLAACATVETPPPERAVSGPPLERFEVAGRIGVVHEEGGFSGSLRWQHAPEGDDLLILSPLGQGVARVVGTSQEVTLTAGDKVYRAADAETLSEQVLGWRLPLAGLPYWIQGRPMPGGGATVESPGRLRQSGWTIETSGYGTVADRELPRRVVLKSGNLQVKLVVDEWGVH